MTPSIGGDQPERSQCVAKPESPEKDRAFPERVIDTTRVLLVMKPSEPRLFTDSKDFFLPSGVSHANQDDIVGVSDQLLKLSVSLKVRMHVEVKSDVFEDKKAAGQAFFIRSGNRVVMVTVEHNFCDVTNEAGQHESFSTALIVSTCKEYHLEQVHSLWWDADKLTDEDRFYFAPGESNAFWKYGKELQIIDLTNEARLLRAFESGEMEAFETVSATFVVEEGMQVGIMAKSCIELLAEHMEERFNKKRKEKKKEEKKETDKAHIAAAPFSVFDWIKLKFASHFVWNKTDKGTEKETEEDNYKETGYEAQRGDTFVTVGRITHIGKEHVEYNVNTVPGFSGAPVFLLCPEREGHMNIIAVHAGYSEGRNTNFGFLVADDIASV